MSTVDHRTYNAQFEALKCCVLIPTYNNAGSIAAVLNDVLTYTSHVCVVNDGSTDATAEILAAYKQIHVHSYARNRGKGWALRQGFDYTRSLGYDYAISIDSDGQHYADDLPVFLEALAKDGESIYIGARNMEQSSVPGKSSFGNKFSNFWFKFETGIVLPDTQSGYRLYPIRLMKDMWFWTVKYEFEVEVIVKAAWRGIGVKSVPVKVYYPPAEERVTHFRPFQDFSRISVLNTVLVSWCLICIFPRNVLRYFQKKSPGEIIDEHLLRSHEPALVKALSVALGMFFGIAPFWGLQMVMVFAIAWIFRLNKALALIVSNISIPPMIPLILYASYRCGGLILGAKTQEEILNSVPLLGVVHDWMSYTIANLHIKDAALSGRIVRNLWQYIIGSLLLAAVASVVSGLATYVFVKVRAKKTKSPDKMEW